MIKEPYSDLGQHFTKAKDYKESDLSNLRQFKELSFKVKFDFEIHIVEGKFYVIKVELYFDLMVDLYFDLMVNFDFKIDFGKVKNFIAPVFSIGNAYYHSCLKISLESPFFLHP